MKEKEKDDYGGNEDDEEDNGSEHNSDDSDGDDGDVGDDGDDMLTCKLATVLWKEPFAGAFGDPCRIFSTERGEVDLAMVQTYHPQKRWFNTGKGRDKFVGPLVSQFFTHPRMSI